MRWEVKPPGECGVRFKMGLHSRANSFGDVQCLSSGLVRPFKFISRRQITVLGEYITARLTPVKSGDVLSTRMLLVGHLAISKVEMAVNQGCRRFQKALTARCSFCSSTQYGINKYLNDLGTGTTFLERLKSVSAKKTRQFISHPTHR